MGATFLALIFDNLQCFPNESPLVGIFVISLVGSGHGMPLVYSEVSSDSIRFAEFFCPSYPQHKKHKVE